MNWNWLPKDSGVPNLALCWWVQPGKTCLSTHERVITVSALDINLKQEKKEKFWKVISPVCLFLLLVGKNGTGTVLGKMALK